MAEKYRPSNGTEGDCFQAAWCEKCERDREYQESNGGKPGCEILARTMACDVDDPRYPIEWIVDADGPKCTAFILAGTDLPAPRCTKTPDMFEEPT